MLAHLAARIRAQRAAARAAGDGQEEDEDEEGEDGPRRIVLDDNCVVQ